MCSILWSLRVIFAFLEERRQNKCCLWESSWVFYMSISGLMWLSVNVFQKAAIANDGCAFAYFCGGHKNDLRL